MGRMEDWSIKGLDRAARAVGQACGELGLDEKLELLVRGAPAGEPPSCGT